MAPAAARIRKDGPRKPEAFACACGVPRVCFAPPRKRKKQNARGDNRFCSVDLGFCFGAQQHRLDALPTKEIEFYCTRPPAAPPACLPALPPCKQRGERRKRRTPGGQRTAAGRNSKPIPIHPPLHAEIRVDQGRPRALYLGAPPSFPSPPASNSPTKARHEHTKHHTKERLSHPADP